MSTSKSIGNSFERRVATILSTKLGGNWIRTPSSGAFIGGKNIKRTSVMTQEQTRLFASDLIPPEEYSDVYVECKKRAKFNFSSLLGSGSIEFDRWITQIMSSIGASAAIPVLIFSEKFGKPYIALPYNYLCNKQSDTSEKFDVLNFITCTLNQSFVLYYWKNPATITFMITELTDRVLELFKVVHDKHNSVGIVQNIQNV